MSIGPAGPDDDYGVLMWLLCAGWPKVMCPRRLWDQSSRIVSDDDTAHRSSRFAGDDLLNRQLLNPGRFHSPDRLISQLAHHSPHLHHPRLHRGPHLHPA
ncbi:hypothetical protein HMPREF1979_00006 [Actinomyces johnsonii F0542]|uniref:Uncharacterized protein n=1 Tax=Actinomyces johnsonii F0542 TaxID=1321818 RepID=U1QVM5_9ACTO|nr:hypothetical protein HMPREF1979_00006 [Actinomyces johnsonii F0542]